MNYMRRTLRKTFNAIEYSSISSFKESFSLGHQSGGIIINNTSQIQLSWINRKSQQTLVTFSAAITNRNATDIPIFTGWGMTKDLDCNVLMVSDPNLALDQELALSWYLNSPTSPHFEAELTEVLEHISSFSQLYLFGASGGGFAALNFGQRLPDSTAIVCNPQTDIRKFSYYSTYKRMVWGSIPIPAGVGNLLSAYENYKENLIVFIQNSGDRDHLEQHFSPFMQSSHKDNQIIPLLPFISPGHLGLTAEDYASVIRTILDSGPDRSELESCLKEFQFQRR